MLSEISIFSTWCVPLCDTTLYSEIIQFFMFLDYLLVNKFHFLCTFHTYLLSLTAHANLELNYFPFFLRANDYLEYNKNEINYERRTSLTFYIN